jgi:outer membrane protein assembly factor BamB
MHYRAAMLILTLFLSTAALADNWPQWRGPTLDGASAETDLPTRWGPEENVAWKLAMPARSGSTPIVWEDRLFVSVGWEPDESRKLALWCIDRSTGKVLWKRTVSEGNERKHKQNLSSPSPVTDGEAVYVLNGTGAMKAFRFDGTEIWARDLPADYGPFGLNWGYASSPLLHEGALYVQVLHGTHTDDPSYILRIDKRTGKTVWRVERPTKAQAESPDAYSTPLLIEHDGKELLVVSGGDAVTGHDPKTGAETWRATVLNPDNSGSYRIVTTPLFADGVLIASGKRKPLVALRLGGSGDVTNSHVLWTRDRSTDVPSPVSDGERLYVVTDKGILTCLNLKTGEVVWGPERLETAAYSASPVLADGMIYATSESGITTVVRAGPKFEVVARNDLAGYTLASPAISDGQIFLRTEETLYAIGERRSAEGAAAGR